MRFKREHVSRSIVQNVSWKRISSQGVIQVVHLVHINRPDHVEAKRRFNSNLYVLSALSRRIIDYWIIGLSKSDFTCCCSSNRLPCLKNKLIFSLITFELQLSEGTERGWLSYSVSHIVRMWEGWRMRKRIKGRERMRKRIKGGEMRRKEGGRFMGSDDTSGVKLH